MHDIRILFCARKKLPLQWPATAALGSMSKMTPRGTRREIRARKLLACVPTQAISIEPLTLGNIVHWMMTPGAIVALFPLLALPSSGMHAKASPTMGRYKAP
jgi:hypothetical protein